MTTPSPSDSLLVHADFVRRVAVALVGRDAADDLCQETWLTALRRAPAASRSLLGTMLRNLFRDERRRQLRQAVRERGAAASEIVVPAAAEIVAREELRRQVVAAVMALPPELRDVVLLRYYEDLDSAAIGARLGRPAGTVRWQLHEAVQQLRQRLDGEHGERRAWVVPLGWWSTAQLGAVAAVFKLAWPLRAAAAAVLLLAIGWLALPNLFGTAAPLPVAPLPLATASQAREAGPAPLPADERQLAKAVVAASPHGADELWGRVVRAADGTAVEATEVQLQHRDADEFACNDLEHGARIDTLATARTDADGRFAFKVAPAHMHRLHVQAAGLGPATVTQCLGGREYDVELAAGASIEGVVREAGTGRALAGVSVRVDLGGEFVRLARSTTAPDGTFRFRDLPAAKVQVSVSSPEHEGASEVRDLQPGGIVSLQFEIGRGRVVTGRVVDAANGVAIAGAAVTDLWVFTRAASTDRDGRYVLGGVTQRSLFARADGYAMACVDLPAAATTFDLALVRGSSVRGRLVDERGNPIRGYAAAITSFMVTQGVMDEDWRPCEVGDDGVFVCAQLDPRRQYGLYVRASGRGARALALPETPAAGQMLDVGDVVLRPEARIEGKVVGGDGKPRPSARLQLGVDDVREGAAAILTTPWNRSADREGRFVITGLAAGSYRLTVQDDSSQQVVASGPYVLRDGEVLDGLELAIPTGLSVSGRLVAPGGAPLPAGFELYLTPVSDGKAKWTRSVEGGSFRFEGLEPGDYSLGCLAPAKGWSMPPVARLAAGAHALEVAVFPAGTVRGRVVDGDGKPTKAKLHAAALGITTVFFREVGTEADGSFTLEVAPDFVGTIWARDPDNMFRQTKIENVAVGASDLVLQLR